MKLIIRANHLLWHPFRQQNLITLCTPAAKQDKAINLESLYSPSLSLMIEKKTYFGKVIP